MAACIVSLAGGDANGGGAANTNGGGRKRNIGILSDRVWDCPCNTSYVSQSCCEVSDGLVWEGQEFKLGELVR